MGKGGRPLGLRKGWDAVCHYSGRVGGKLLVRREGWEVVVLVIATD